MFETADGAVLPPTPAFADFFRALHGLEPFPWQRRLACQVATTGRWPAEIGVPTGLGKTACLDIAVWWLASQAHLQPIERTAPTRIWWVVNRRLLVDSTYRRAEHIQRQLENRESKAASSTDDDGRHALASVAKRLSSLSASSKARPLEVIRLRGGVSIGRPTNPSQPAIVLSTVPMYGSRLLFRGYGSSRSLRPIDAALAGTDSLVLLDEAHLARHLSSLLNDLAECAPSKSRVIGEARDKPTLISLTATGDVAATNRLDIDQLDKLHPVVNQRLSARKPVEVRCFEKGDVSTLLARTAQELIKQSDRPAAFLVFANMPSTARAVFNKLQANKGLRAGSDIWLLTGRTRECDAADIRDRLMDRERGMMASQRVSSQRERNLVVVATQTLEVGADIDAEFLVTEACGVRALTQRLGRLNRRGEFPHARAVYLHVSPKGSKKDPSWPVYGSEPATVLERLQGACSRDSNILEMNPDRVSDILGAPEDKPGQKPEIMFGLLWEWLKTTTPPEGEAPVEPYFSGLTDPLRPVAIIWRVHVPKVGDRLWPRFRDDETVDIPVREVRDALRDDEIQRVGSDGATIESCTSGDLRPGDLVVLRTDRGHLDKYGWNPKSRSSVLDISLQRAGLPLDSRALELLVGANVGPQVDVALGRSGTDDEIDEEKSSAAVRMILDKVKSAGPPAGWDPDSWGSFVDGLDMSVRAPSKEVPRLVLQNKKNQVSATLDEFDELSLANSPINLDTHNRDVAELARQIANRLGVPGKLSEILEFAGRYHDIGKGDRRFQRQLDPEGLRQGIVLAKSDIPEHLRAQCRALAGWPRGGRHESLSARLVARWLEENPHWGNSRLRKLLLHLVISHHGKGRPLVLPVKDQTATTVTAEIDRTPVEASALLSDTDWTQPARFHWLNKEFGPWGLALLEAILRQADHIVSARTGSLN